MEEHHPNLSAFNFSPHFWYKAFDKGISLADHFGRKLDKETGYADWLRHGELEHPRLELHLSEEEGIIHGRDYDRIVRNDYFHNVSAINKYGVRITAESTEQLMSKATVDPEAAVNYVFRVDSLHHLATVEFMEWLVFNRDAPWLRWQVFFNFLVSKSPELTGQLYTYMWCMVFGEIKFNHAFFESVSQYDRFRDQYEVLIERAEPIESRLRKLNTDG